MGLKLRKKIINRTILIRSAENLHVYEALESSFFFAACAIRAHEALFNLF